MINYEVEKAIWQKYTDDDLTNDDIDEINQNVRDFARVLIKLQKELIQNTTEVVNKKENKNVQGQ